MNEFCSRDFLGFWIFGSFFIGSLGKKSKYFSCIKKLNPQKAQRTQQKFWKYTPPKQNPVPTHAEATYL